MRRRPNNHTLLGAATAVIDARRRRRAPHPITARHRVGAPANYP